MIDDQESVDFMPVAPSRIHWTLHAVNRVAERFGFDPEISIPCDRILKAARAVDEGEEFHVKTFLVEFVCKRDQETVAVVTVMFRT